MSLRGIVAAILSLGFSTHAQDSPLAPPDALKNFEAAPGLAIELVAAEPLTASPCAMAFDERGRLFVAENRGYPIGPKPGEPPVGIIAMLEDTDGDGRMDRRTVFADGLTFPNGVMPWRGGLFVTCAPELLFLKDTDDDGRADERDVVLTGFDIKGSTQLRVNAPLLGPDGWVWLASGLSGGHISNPAHAEFGTIDLKTDLRFDPHSGRFEAVDGRSQYGHSFDDFGRRFICMNRVQVQHVVLSSRDLRRNTHLAFSQTVQDCPELIPNRFMRSTGGAARLYPISSNLTTADSHSGTFSAACAVTIWRGGALPADYDGAAFSCDPTGNLIHVDRLVPNGASFAAEPILKEREFLASRDDWFRPVFLASGPDGALYVCDMVRKTIEHPDYLPEEVRKRTDFESGKDLGRIWRIRAKDELPQPPPAERFNNTQQLATRLINGTGWEQDTALRLIAEEPRAERVATLRGAWTEARKPQGRAALLGALAISSALEDADLEKALRDPDTNVREVAFTHCGSHPPVLSRLLKITADRRSQAGERERFQLALVLGNVPGEEATRELGELMLGVGRGDRWLGAAVLSGLKGRAADLLPQLFLDMRGNSGDFDFFFQLGRTIALGKERLTLDELLTDYAHGEDAYAMVAGFCQATGTRIAAGETRAESLVTTAVADLRAAAKPSTGSRVLDPETARTSRSLKAQRAAVALLAYAPWEIARDPLTGAALHAQSPEIAQAALQSLVSFDRPEAAEPLLTTNRWAGFTPTQREAVLSALLARSAFVPALLEAVESGAVLANALSPPRRKALLQHRDPAVRARAEKLFSGPPVDREKALAEAKAALTLSANAPHGREVFRNLCASCHRLDREGHAVGPDLFDIRNQSKENILFHIVVPEAEVAPAFAAYTAETRDGRTLLGVLASETPTSITLRMPLGQETTLLRSELNSLTAAPESLMPPGLESAMSRQDLADLLAYLKGEK